MAERKRKQTTDNIEYIKIFVEHIRYKKCHVLTRIVISTML